MGKAPYQIGGRTAKKLEDATAPDFTLIDTEGQSVTLSDYRGEKHVVLVFNRGFV
jgi:peroxiredoxin